MDFTIWVDNILKSEEASEDHRFVDGLASAEIKDQQGETVVQKGFDLEPLLRSGWINWDHLPGPENLIGEPREADVTLVREHPRLKNHPLVRSGKVDGLGLYFKGELNQNQLRADETWYHVNNPRRTRPIGWSIQGRSFERDGPRITKSQLRHMAITHQPVLHVSFADVCKSLTTGIMQPILLENLDQRVTSTLWGDACSCGHLKKSGRFSGRYGALVHMTKCQGKSPEEAHAFLKAIIRSGVAAR